MRKFYTISLLVSVYLLCSARSCSKGDEGQNHLEIARDSIRSAFTAADLNPERLEAFRLSAGKRFGDVADYYRIMNDTSTDLTFRQKAASLLKKMFIRDNTAFIFLQENRKQAMPLSRVIELGLGDVGQGHFVLTQLAIEKDPFIKTNDTLYTGLLRFTLSASQNGSGNSTGLKPCPVTVKVYLVKARKDFGKESVSVWTLFFGDMN
jgi:hypothetical protein